MRGLVGQCLGPPTYQRDRRLRKEAGPQCFVGLYITIVPVKLLVEPVIPFKAHSIQSTLCAMIEGDVLRTIIVRCKRLLRGWALERSERASEYQQ